MDEFEKDFLITLLCTVPLGLSISLLVVAEADLHTQVLEPLNLAYATTNVSFAQTNLEKALEGIEENSRGINYFITRIPPNNQKVQVWKSKIEKYQAQLADIPEPKQKSTDTVPRLGTVINWHFMLFFQFASIFAFLNLSRKHP